MINTLQINPAPELTPFVNCYLLREFDTGGTVLSRPWTATYEVYLTFFLKDRPLHLLNEETGYLVKGSSYMAVQGLATSFNGIMFFNGHYSILNVCFKPSGFHKIFNIPLDLLANKIFDSNDLFSIPARNLYGQLVNSTNIKQMASFIDAFLLYFLSKQKSYHLYDGITIISNYIQKHSGIVNVDRLAVESNMSIRNFERSFTKQVGVSPKLFSRILRFNTALLSKIKEPGQTWTSIAHDCGYFDQMHLIKDFKRFAGSSPNTFFLNSPVPQENIVAVSRS